jgi:hypothetical protein
MVVVLLPVLGDGDITLIELVSSYVLVLLSVGAFLYGLLLLVADLTVPKLLLLAPSPGPRAWPQPTSAAARNN